MACLDDLRRAGLTVEREGERLRVTPARYITDAHRRYLRAHRDELLRELGAGHACASVSSPAPVVGGLVQRRAWQVTLGGRPICWMIGEPITRPEAQEAARWRWPEADIGSG